MYYDKSYTYCMHARYTCIRPLPLKKNKKKIETLIGRHPSICVRDNAIVAADYVYLQTTLEGPFAGGGRPIPPAQNVTRMGR